MVTAASADARLRLKYWDGSAWKSFDGTEPEVSLGTTGEKVSPWIDLPASAKQNSLRIRYFGIGHYSAEFQSPQFEFRGPLEKRMR